MNITNPFFSYGNHSSEQRLYDDIVTEFISSYGLEVYYLPRKIIGVDNILFEDIESVYKKAIPIAAYASFFEGFEGSGHIISKFSFAIDDQADFFISKNQFRILSQPFSNLISESRPLEGDLIYLPMSKSLFEIKFVEHESPFYNMKKNSVFLLKTTLFNYSNQEISTGISEIDSIGYNNSASVTILAMSSDDFTASSVIGKRFIQETENTEISGVISFIKETSPGMYQIELISVKTSGDYIEFLEDEYLEFGDIQFLVTEVRTLETASAITSKYPFNYDSPEYSDVNKEKIESIMNNPLSTNAEIENYSSNIVIQKVTKN